MIYEATVIGPPSITAKGWRAVTHSILTISFIQIIHHSAIELNVKRELAVINYRKMYHIFNWNFVHCIDTDLKYDNEDSFAVRPTQIHARSANYIVVDKMWKRQPLMVRNTTGSGPPLRQLAEKNMAQLNVDDHKIRTVAMWRWCQVSQ